MSEEFSDVQWDDLKDLDREAIIRLIKEKKAFLRSINDQVKDLRSERKEQIHIVKSLRSAIVGIEKSDSGRKKLLAEFHNSRNAQSSQKQRNSKQLSTKKN